MNKEIGPLRLWLVRHGVTEWNDLGKWQGWSDVPLSKAGREQAQRLKSRLRNQHFEIVYSSDLSRAVETAQLAGFEPLQDRRLREISFGIFEGGTSEQNKQRPEWPTKILPAKARAFMGGESYAQLEARLEDWLKDLPNSGTVIAFTHGGVIRSLVSALLKLNPEVAPGWWKISSGHTAITVLECWRANNEAHWLLLRFNDTAHLETETLLESKLSQRQYLEKRNALWQQLRMSEPNHQQAKVWIVELMALTHLTKQQILAGLGWPEN